MRPVSVQTPRRAKVGLWALLGLVLGLAAGLVLAWVVWPVQYTETDPSDLMAERKALWADLVADGYALTGDLDAARARLNLLGVSDPGAFVAQVAETRLDQGASLQHVRAMARLAERLGGITARLLVYIATPAPTPTATPTPQPTPTATPSPRATQTPTPEPTLTPTPTQGPSAQVFRLVGKDYVCAPGAGPDIIAVFLLDEDERGVPGIRIEVTWAGGADAFYTGLKPEVNPGYADFVAERGVEYSITVGTEGSEIVRGIRTSDEPCPEIEGPYHHRWVLRFRRTRS